MRFVKSMCLILVFFSFVGNGIASAADDYDPANLVLLTAKSDVFHISLDIKKIDLDFSHVKAEDIPVDIQEVDKEILGNYNDLSFVKDVERYDEEKSSQTQLDDPFPDLIKFVSIPFILATGIVVHFIMLTTERF